jgi:SAM-dependent methyltransferase
MREAWDSEAACFDDQPDHGLSDARVRTAWRALLQDALPAPPARVLDVGCGTGSVAVLLAELGFTVQGIDLISSDARAGGREGPARRRAGCPAAGLLPLVESATGAAELRHLPDPALWGGPLEDERYLIVAAT